MNVVLIAGGKGERLGMQVPKCLVELRPGWTILEQQLENFRKHSAESFTLALGYKAEMVKEYCEDKNIFVNYLIEKEPLGTGGWLKNIKLDEPFLACNCDNLIRRNPFDLVMHHENWCGDCVATVLVTMVEDAGESGTVEVANDKVVSFKEKTGKKIPGLINAGHYFFTPKIYDYLPDKNVVSLERDVFPVLAAKGLLGAYVVPPDCFCAPDTPERLQKAKEAWKQ